MKKLCKTLAIVLTLATVMMSFFVFTASAATPETLYLSPSANWKGDGARFAAYFFGNGEKWVSMTDADSDGIYEVAVPAGFPSVIFCRMNPGNTANNWNNKWNQTSDLTIPTTGTDLYTVKEGTWDKGGGTWSTLNSTCEHEGGAPATCTTPQICTKCGEEVASALGHAYDASHKCGTCGTQAFFTIAGSGAHLGKEWDPAHAANDMTYDEETQTYTKVYENVAAGSYKLKCARDHDWGTAYPSSDQAYKVEVAGSTVTVTLKGTAVNVVVEAPHEHKYEANVTPPTCTEKGFTTHTCSCGDNYVDTEVDALGHSFAGGTCSVCGDPDPDYVPPVDPEVPTEPEPEVPTEPEPEVPTEPEPEVPTEPETPTEPESPSEPDPEAPTEPEAPSDDLVEEPAAKPSLIDTILVVILAFFKKILAMLGL